MIISGQIISLVTFPGVIVHEISHKFFCDILGIPVYKVCYFQYGNPAGYVVHEPTTKLREALLIGVGPLIINTILCMLFTFPSVFPITILSVDEYDSSFLFLMWLGISIGTHAFPSNQDINEFLEIIKKSNQRDFTYVFAKIFSNLLRLVNFLRFIWIDVIYAVSISIILPKIIMLF